MDSEVTNLSFVKGLTSGISSGNVLVANAAVSDNDFLKLMEHLLKVELQQK